MPGDPSAPEDGRHAAFDWIDVLLGFFTLCAGFGLASMVDGSEGSSLFKYGLALALVVVLGARRIVIGPPRVTAVGRGKTALGLLGAAAMLFGLVIASGGGYLFLSEHRTPIAEPAKVDRDAIERDLGLPALLTRCTRDGKVMRGRECMTPEERAREAAADEQTRATERAKLEAEKKGRLSRLATIAGAGAALVLLGIGLDILRSRRDAAPG